MVVCIFIIMGPVAFTSAAVLTVNLLFSPELRLARKYLHMVAPEREHSFGFIQVRTRAHSLRDHLPSGQLMGD